MPKRNRCTEYAGVVKISIKLVQCRFNMCLFRKKLCLSRIWRGTASFSETMSCRAQPDHLQPTPFMDLYTISLPGSVSRIWLSSAHDNTSYRLILLHPNSYLLLLPKSNLLLHNFLIPIWYWLIPITVKDRKRNNL